MKIDYRQLLEKQICQHFFAPCRKIYDFRTYNMKVFDLNEECFLLQHIKGALF